MNIRDWFEGFQSVYDHILLNCGFSPDSQSETMKTQAKRALTFSNPRILDKYLIIKKLWNGKGERPYIFTIPDDENMNKTLEHEDAKARIELNLSNYIEEFQGLEE